MSKIGVGIVTCNRQGFFQECIKSVVSCKDIDYLVVCNDGTPYSVSSYSGANKIIQNTQNVGVGISKNNCFRTLLEESTCDYIFIVEDDMLIKDTSVFQTYIKTSKVSGIQHLMFSQHGPACKKNGQPNPRLTINYSDNTGVQLYPNCVGAFCLYTRKCLETCGLFDQRYLNGTEHLDHTYKLSKEGFTTPWWWFCDIKDSWKYIVEQACSEVNSVIRPRSDWQNNIKIGWEYFKTKYGFYPTEIPDTSQEEVVKFIKQCKST